MIHQIVKFNVKPDHLESFKTALLEDKKNAEQEAGYLEMKLFEDKNKPNIIFCYERWKDQDALDYHREHPYTVKICRLVDTALASPLEILNLSRPLPAPAPRIKHPDPGDDVFIIFFIFKIKLQYRRRLLAQFKTHVHLTRQEPGCLLFDLYTVDGAEDTLAVYEHWRNESVVRDIHFKQPHSQETGKLLEKALKVIAMFSSG